jgi:uncharacterized protein (DUF2336 family)
MSQVNLSIADEVEAVISAGSAEKCGETAGRVTALFLASAGSYSAEQIELFGDVFERLVKTIELRALADVSARIALAELSAQLAPVPQAPTAVIRRLARHEEISVAGPVLTESPRLSNEDLIEIAKARGEKHLIAIAGRWWLQEVVTDVLLTRRFPSVSKRLVNNPGARLSAAGFVLILAQAKSDPELAVEVGIRADLPAELRKQLVRSATQAVRTKLLSRAPAYLFEEIRSAISAASAEADRQLSRVDDFRAAKELISRLKRAGQLNETTLMKFAKQQRYEETVAALAALSESSVEIVRPLMQTLRSDGILVPCKVAGLGWDTVDAVLDCRFSAGITADDQRAKLRRQFAELTSANAQRMLNLWMVRSGSPTPNAPG